MLSHWIKMKEEIREILDKNNFSDEKIINFIKIEKKKSTTKIFFVQTEKSYINYPIYIIYKIKKNFKISLFSKNEEKKEIDYLKKKYNKNLEFFLKENEIKKKYFYSKKFSKKNFLEILYKNEIEKLSWLRCSKKIDGIYENVIFLDKNKISHISLNLIKKNNYFVNFENSTKNKIRNKIENIENSFLDYNFFEIKFNIFKFSKNFQKKKIKEILSKKKIWEFKNNLDYINKILNFSYD